MSRDLFIENCHTSFITLSLNTQKNLATQGSPKFRLTTTLKGTATTPLETREAI